MKTNSNIKITHISNDPKGARRQYNQWVANETIEDYSLRYTPRSYRKWPELLIANTAIGSISFLALEAIGASIAFRYGFGTAFWAILVASIIIFITAIPISYHAAKYNIDIDLITRSAGFGYVGSTITSLIYASFCFIFFALEAAILAQALKLFTGLPLALGYLTSSLIIIPMVFYGITFINKLQLWSLPIWLIMMFAPFIMVLLKEPQAIDVFINFSGELSGSNQFNITYFGFAIGISLSMIAQIGEQVDYIRFMPPLHNKNKLRWWLSMLIAGPGWIILGFAKQLGGIFLAAIAILAGMSVYEAKTPVQMYYIGYQYVFDNPSVALAASCLFVIISQIKINVTNAYAGSLAWSNFFSRISHSHPGRVVWMVFNIFIALLLMELGVFDVLEKVLGLYSNVAIAWIGALVADLIINKPLGLSPKIIEFKRAYLYDFNPVGVGSMGFASVISVLAFIGIFGEMAQSYSSLIALFLALLLSPLIAWITGGKYYIARANDFKTVNATHATCQICEKAYEIEDMAYCPFHTSNICSLCCSLESLCHDVCKKTATHSIRDNIGEKIQFIFNHKISLKAALRLFDFISLTGLLVFIIGIIAWLIFSVQAEKLPPDSVLILKTALIQFFVLSIVIICLITWWVLLVQESRQIAEDDLEEQNEALEDEIEERRIAENKAYNLANYDTLTGLPNRNLLQNRIEQAIDLCERTRKKFAILFLDLDRFKLINDSMGHDAGDELLLQIATRLKKCLRKSDVISRQGGDEFVILLQNINHIDEISYIAQNILNVMQKPFEIHDHDIQSSFSIGISIYPDDGKEIANLLKNADMAMYEVKNENKNSFKFFNKTMNDNAIANLLLDQELRLALKNNQLKLYYQPQLESGKIVGLEALVRWHHPQKGLLYPEEFIELAEQSDLILKLGSWVIEKACWQAAQWLNSGLAIVPIAINISQKQFSQSDFASGIKQALAKNKLAGKFIELELTERSLMDDSKEIRHQLQQLKDLDLSLSIDDFGTGYSSLNHLKVLPINKLKIDISFINNIVTCQQDRAIVKTIINLAKNLNLKIIAEGVETKEQLSFLESYGAPCVQGFFFYQALSAEEITVLLQSK